MVSLPRTSVQDLHYSERQDTKLFLSLGRFSNAIESGKI